MVRKIMKRISDEQIQEDLENYRLRAIELGANDAKIIPTDHVLVDDRVVAKCTYPKCVAYGTNINCPPYAMPPDTIRKVVSNFNYAVFIKLEIPSNIVAGPGAVDVNLNPWRKKLAEIVAKIEAEAFYDSYYLALGFASGSCKAIFCPKIECNALTTGQPCRHALKARSAMEAVGMDAYSMASEVGWDIFPIGMATLPSEVPYGLRLGLVLIH